MNNYLIYEGLFSHTEDNGYNTCRKRQWAGGDAALYTHAPAVCFLTLHFHLPVAKQWEETEGLLHFLDKP